MNTYIIQIRDYPFTKGKTKSQSIIIKDKTITAAIAKIQLLYEELDKKEETTLLFRQ